MTSNGPSDKGFEPMLYKKRWLILSIFSSASMLNAYHWIHLNIISDRVLYIWNQTIPGSTSAVRQLSVDWLSMVYLLAYLPLIVPATWACERFGLRITTLIAVILNALGGWIKCVGGELAVSPDRETPMNPGEAGAFAILMFGQVLDATAQVFILGVPAQLAATWFGEREIGTATSIGVLANQLGVAIGFAIPPLVVPIPPGSTEGTQSSTDTFDNVRRHMMYLLYVGAAVNTLPVIATIFFFKKAPPTEPTFAQFARRLSRRLSRRRSKIQDTASGNGDAPSSNPTGSVSANGQDATNSKMQSAALENGLAPSSNETESALMPKRNRFGFKKQLVKILRNCSYMLLTISYGMNTGVYYALGTLLNVVLQQYFPGNSNIGWVGFVMIVAGILGSIVAGLLLDKTKKYRIIITVIYALALGFMGAFTGLLLTRILALTFVSSFFLGLTMTGFLPIGFEYAAELTYPANEGLTSGLLNASAQTFGIIFTIGASQMSSRLDVLWINIFFTCLLALGLLLLIFVKEDLRRLTMQNEAQLAAQEKANQELNRTQL